MKPNSTRAGRAIAVLAAASLATAAAPALASADPQVKPVMSAAAQDPGGGGTVSIGGRQPGNSVAYGYTDPFFADGYWWRYRYTDQIDTWGTFWYRDKVWECWDGTQWLYHGTERCFDSGGCSWV
jgi:hypothetical protein